MEPNSGLAEERAAVGRGAETLVSSPLARKCPHDRPIQINLVYGRITGTKRCKSTSVVRHGGQQVYRGELLEAVIPRCNEMSVRCVVQYHGTTFSNPVRGFLRRISMKRVYGITLRVQET
jgi:hypothetical protein